MQRLTLCMIVRDEARMLPACLASVAGVVDEIVVVDTGSTDGTIDLARNAGARVIRKRWRDDFSAARNASIATVRQGFVLVLDADERLAPGAGRVLREEIERDEIDCGLLALHDADALDAEPSDVLSGRRRLAGPVLLGRLLRRTDDLAWEGVVHEHLTRWAARNPRRKQLDAAIVHFGAVPQLRAQRGKSDRNRRLLELRCRAEPGNPLALNYLAHELLAAGDFARAASVIEDAWKALARIREPAGDAAVTVATTRVCCLLKAGKLREARETLDVAEQLSGEHPNLLVLRAAVLERQWLDEGRSDRSSSLLERAEAACVRCLELDGVPYAAPVLSGSTSWSGATRLGILRLLRGKFDEALRTFDAVLATRPSHVEARLGRAEALIACDQAPQALRELEPLLHEQLPDGWILAAAAGLACQDFAAITPIAAQARRSLAKREPLAAHRRRTLERIESLAPSALPRSTTRANVDVR